MHWKIMTFHRCHRCYRSIYLYAEEKIIHVVKWKFDLKLPFKRFEDRMFDILLKSSSKLQNLINWQSLEDTQVGFTLQKYTLGKYTSYNPRFLFTSHFDRLYMFLKSIAAIIHFRASLWSYVSVDALRRSRDADRMEMRKCDIWHG